MPGPPLLPVSGLPGTRGAGTHQGAWHRLPQGQSRCQGPWWQLQSHAGDCQSASGISGTQTCLGSPEEGAEPGELFSRSRSIIVAKETSSWDLAWNTSASVGPHIHLAQTALEARAGADKGRDGDEWLRRGHRGGGITVALL